MAKKGQSFKKFSNEERAKIVNDYIKGNTYEKVANKYGVSMKTVETMVRKYRKTGTTIAEQRGRPKEKNLTIYDYKERYEILKKYQAFLKVKQEKK